MTGRLVLDLLFLKKIASCEVKASSQYFNTWTLRTRLGHIITAKGIRTRFFKKNISHFIFY